MAQKRAGKGRQRNANQKEPQGKRKQKPDTIAEDNLPPAESRDLELTAIAQGWVLGASQEVREKLIKKTLGRAYAAGADTRDIVSVFRAISIAEQRQQSIELRRRGEELRKESLELRRQELELKRNPPKPEIPEAPAPNTGPPKNHEVVAKLIASKRVRQALDSRSPATKKADISNANNSLKIADGA